MQLAHFDQEDPKENPIAPLNRSQAANTDHIERELQLVQLQKEKLALELEVLRLRQSTVLPPASTNSGSTASASVKKRVNDWPQDFVPGTSAITIYDSLDLPAFVAGYLVMIKHYDTEVNKSMLAIPQAAQAHSESYMWYNIT